MDKIDNPEPSPSKTPLSDKKLFSILYDDRSSFRAEEMTMFKGFLKECEQDENLQCLEELESLKLLVRDILFSSDVFVSRIEKIHSEFFSHQTKLAIPKSTIENTTERYRAKDVSMFGEAEKELELLLKDSFALMQVSKEWTQYQKESGRGDEHKHTPKVVELTPEELTFVTPIVVSPLVEEAIVRSKKIDVNLIERRGSNETMPDERLIMSPTTPVDKKEEKRSFVVSKLKTMRRKTSLSSIMAGGGLDLGDLTSPRSAPNPVFLENVRNHSDASSDDVRESGSWEMDSPTPVIVKSMSPDQRTDSLQDLAVSKKVMEDIEFLTPKKVMEAIKGGNFDAFASLVDKIVDLNGRVFMDKGTYLHCATTSGQTMIVDLLLKKGAGVDIADQHGRTSLHFAASSGKREIIITLLGNGAKMTSRDNYGYSPFLLCLKHHHFDLVPDFLLFGADYNVKRDNGMTALHEAMYYGDDELVKYLLKQGSLVKLNQKDQYGQTALHKGSEKAPPSLIHYFMKAENVDYLAIDEQGRNIFHLCAIHAREDFFTFLDKFEPLALSKYMRLMNASDYMRSMTPLHLAIDTCAMGTIKSYVTLLRKMNVDLNIMDSSKSTPYVYASKVCERFVLEYRPVEGRTIELKEKIGQMLLIKQFLVQYDRQPKVIKKKK